MAFEFLSTLDSTTLMLVLLVFLLFVMSMKRALSVAWNAVWIAGISVIFPLAMNKLFNFNIPTDVDSLVSFIVLGLGAYFIYLIAASVYKMLEEVEKVTNKIPRPSVGKKEHLEEPRVDKREQKYVELKEREKEKELNKREEELNKKEEQIRWMSKLEESKKSKRAHDDEYAELKDDEPKKSHVEPLNEIKHKKKHKDDDED